MLRNSYTTWWLVALLLWGTPVIGFVVLPSPLLVPPAARKASAASRNKNGVYHLFGSNAGCLTRLHLFFKKATPQDRQELYDALESKVTPVPFPIRQATEGLTIRLVEFRDIGTVTKLCVKEYATSLFDRLPLALLVASSTLAKILGADFYDSNQGMVQDHAFLVLATQQDEKVVGMVELSRQPVLVNHIPQLWPMPLWAKELYCQVAGSPQQQHLQPWLTNLLIEDSCRGRGYSKLLVHACHGIARQYWNSSQVHLHCDSTPENVALRLYRSLGYGSKQLVVVDGVPLFYLRKDLR